MRVNWGCTSLFKKKGHIRADCYELKNRNKMAAVITNNGKQHENKGEVDIMENG